MTIVGVNLLWCRPGRVGGSEEYTVRLLDAVRAFDPSLEFALFATSAFASAHPDLASDVRRAPPGAGRRAIRVALERTWLRRRARAVDVVHHAGGTAPPVPVPIVVTIHDLQYRAFPEFFSPVKRAFLRATVPAAARRAAAVVVPSEFVRANVHDAFGVPVDRIVVVPHPRPDPTDVPLPAIRERFGLPDRFVLYPAVTWPHKNHAVLVDAMSHLRRGHADIACVLLGAPGPGDAALDEMVARLGLSGRVRRLGRVSEAERDALYAAALALTFPSRYEGFGAPVIEAMAVGCPVVAAAVPALTEVVGGAGVLVDPDDAAGWATAVAAIADDARRRRSLVEAGHRRVEDFTPARSAAALVTAYRRALA